MTASRRLRTDDGLAAFAVVTNCLLRAGASEKGTERDGEADQRGRRDLEDQEAEQERNDGRPRRHVGGEAADDARRAGSSATEGAAGAGGGGAGQAAGYRQVNARDRDEAAHVRKFAHTCRDLLEIPFGGECLRRRKGLKAEGGWIRGREKEGNNPRSSSARKRQTGIRFDRTERERRGHVVWQTFHWVDPFSHGVLM